MSIHEQAPESESTPDFSPYQYRREILLPTGHEAVITSIRPDHAPILAQALNHLSQESKVKRFLGSKHAFTVDELKRMTECDGIHHLALGMALLTEVGEEGEPIAVARCVRPDANSSLAEVAIVVTDEWQWQGIGRKLLSILASESRRIGISQWKAVYFSDNTPIQKLLNSIAALVEKIETMPGIVETTWRLE